MRANIVQKNPHRSFIENIRANDLMRQMYDKKGDYNVKEMGTNYFASRKSMISEIP